MRHTISECGVHDTVLHTSAEMQGLRVKGSPHWSTAMARSTIQPYSPVESASHTQSPISPHTDTRQKDKQRKLKRKRQRESVRMTAESSEKKSDKTERTKIWI